MMASIGQEQLVLEAGLFVFMLLKIDWNYCRLKAETLQVVIQLQDRLGIDGTQTDGTGHQATAISCV